MEIDGVSTFKHSVKRPFVVGSPCSCIRDAHLILHHQCPQVHPKLRNINPHNVTHSLISQNLGERMIVVQISLLIVTFLSLISRISSLMQTTKKVNPHPRIMPCVNMWSVTLLILFFFFLCHLLIVGACICHIAREGQAEWTTPHHQNVALYVIP